MKKCELERRIAELERQNASGNVREMTVAALSNVVNLQQEVIDRLYLYICNIDEGAVDDYTLSQMKRAAQIAEDYKN